MITLKRRFAGSYYVVQNDDIVIESMGQYTTEVDVDDEGNKWVVSVNSDHAGDFTHRCKTKKEAVQYVNKIFELV